MNGNSSRQFNPSQSQMKKTNVSGRMDDFNGSGNLTQSGRDFNSSNAASLKGKLQTLEEAIQQVAEEMNSHKKDVTSLKTEKDTLQEMLQLKAREVKSTLVQELNKVEEEMKRHFSHQKAENSRLQQQISQLKTEKTVLQNQLIALQRRITDLEMQVGNDDVKYA